MKNLTRRQERELALQYLFALESQQKLKKELFPEDLEELPVSAEGVSRDAYHLDIIFEVNQNLKDIDREISRHLIEWRFERIAMVDRNILRIAVCEIIHNEEVPKAVAIDEAVELAKKYGSEKSPEFINGVLAQVGD